MQTGQRATCSYGEHLGSARDATMEPGTDSHWHCHRPLRVSHGVRPRRNSPNGQ